MREQDFPFSVHITDTVNWNFASKDFEFMLELEPQGCFVLLHDRERVGIATTVNYGKVGWLGNLIVDEHHRKAGAGTLLARHAIRYLTSRNVETVGLYSYVTAVPFYERLGFEYSSELMVLKGRGFSSTIPGNLRKAERGETRDIIDLDKICFGAARRKLLESILRNENNPCYVFVEDGQMLGYAVARRCGDMGELGPMVCRQGRDDVAEALLRCCLGRLEGLEVYLYVPIRESSIIKVLTASKFRETFRVARMFLKPPKVIGSCIYVAESLERG